MNRHQREYEKLKKEADLWQACALCGIRTVKINLDPHHPKGKAGKNILNFVYLCRGCHRWAHRNVEQAERWGLFERNRGFSE